MLPFWLIITISLLGIIIYLGYLYLTWNFNYWKKRNVNGPKPKPFIGTFPSSLNQKQNIIYDLNDIYKRYKKTDRFVGLFMMRNPELLILDPELGRDIFVKYFKHFHDNAAVTWVEGTKEDIIGKNPFMLRGDEWKEKRSEVTPALTTSRIKASYPVMQQVCKKMTNYIKDLQISSETKFTTLDGKNLASRFTIETVADCIYGIEAGTFSKTGSILYQKAKNLFSEFSSAMPKIIISQIIPIFKKIYTFKIFTDQTEKFFIDLMNEAIELRTKSNIERADFLNYIIQLSEKKGLTSMEMAAHTMTFLFDGYETSSMLISHCLLLLSRNKSCQNRLRQEIEENLDENGNLSFEKLTEMKYLDLCINESLRIFPPGISSQKLCTEPIILENYNGSELKCEIGTVITIPHFCYFHDEEFFNEPEKFNPDRFEEYDGGIKKYRDEGKFMPFGDGPRICLGMRFGITQVKTAICELVRNFEITSNPKTRTDNLLDASFILPNLKDGIWLDFKEFKN